MYDYLFAQPSFLSGAGRILDLGGVFDEYDTSESPAEADTKAALADWTAVGNDLRAAMALGEAELAAAGWGLNDEQPEAREDESEPQDRD